MEDVENLPIETVFNLIKNGIMDLDNFEDWVGYLRHNAFVDGYNAPYYEIPVDE